MTDKTNLSQQIRGARDLYPENLALRNWLFSRWREVARSFGYEEIDGPILEKFDLFASKSGEELVNDQMYTLMDRDNEKLGLRPELTPTFSRMVAKKQGELTFPLRWTMFGNAWRYEKPQKGRVRDFWQWELNIVGGDLVAADAEVIALAAKAMAAIGLTADDVVFRINDRRFMYAKLKEAGIGESLFSPVLKVIDKKERMGDNDFTAKLAELGLTTSQIEKLVNFLTAKTFDLSDELNSLFSILRDYGVSDYVKYDPLIVRGITYYTGTVFECFDKQGELRSVFGGGRFDDLVESFGGGKIPAVGFAVGDVVVSELLKIRSKMPKLDITPTQVLVSVFSEELFSQSIEIARILRTNNINTEVYPDRQAKLDKQLKYANKKAISFVVIVGPEEMQTNTLKLKNMATGEQTNTTLDQLPSLITG